MYEAFYGLTEKPFNLTPDPRFLYLSDKHKEAFAHLMFGIKNRCGFVMVSGEIGTGKTTICRSLLNQLDDDIEVAVILNPCLSPEELLRKVNEDFGIDTKADTVKGLIDELNDYLLERNAQGKNCVLLIDEAQNLPPGILEQVRLLSNIETETQKLLQIVLVGQPELAQHLELPELRQLNQRITARYHLEPLSFDETLQYIAFRLRQAGGRKKVHFSRAAVRAVYKHSGGTPRVINAVCDRALLIGFTREVRDISAAIMRQAIREVHGRRLRPKRSVLGSLRQLLPSPATLLAAVAVALMVFLIGPALQDRMQYGFRNHLSNEPRHTAGTPVGSETPLPGTNVAVANVKTGEGNKQGEAVTATAVALPWEGKDPVLVRNAAVSALLRVWNMATLGQSPSGDTPEALSEFALKAGFSCEVLSPALEQLITINLPALVQVKTGDKFCWTALLGIRDEMVTVNDDQGKLVEITRDKFKPFFAGKALIFWKNDDPAARQLKKSMTGPDVEKLQNDLLRLGRLSPPISGVYDPVTGQAISKVQAETGLPVDGITGPKVRMVLTSWLPNVLTPTLHGKKEVSINQPSLSKAVKLDEAALEEGKESKSSPGTKNEKTSPVNRTPDATDITSAAKPAVKPESAKKDDVPVLPSADPVPNILPDMKGGIATNQVQIQQESLSPIQHQDTLPPSKVALPREVTPPAGGLAPIVPQDPREGTL